MRPFLLSLLSFILIYGIPLGAEGSQEPGPSDRERDPSDPVMEGAWSGEDLEDRNYTLERSTVPDTFLYATGGTNLSAPSGSYVRSEKGFDTYENYQVMTGQLKYIPPYDIYPPGQVSGSFDGGEFYNTGFEQMLTPYFGIGASVAWTSLDASRSYSLVDPRDGNRYLIPFGDPDSRQLNLNGLTFDFYLHLPADYKFKPYVSLRFGPATVTGKTHTYVQSFYTDGNSEIHNGRGALYGATAGGNFFISDSHGLRTEVYFARFDFHSNELTTRSYYNTYFTIGLFLYQ